MKASDLRPKTQDQLKEELGNLRKEAFNLRFQKAGGQLGKTGRVRQVRRDVARMMTIAKQKRSGEAPKAKASAPAATEQVAVKRTAKPRPPVSNRSKPRLASRAKAKRK